MDVGGNNRYELLFMDDDVSDPLDNIAAKKEKKVKTAAAAATGNKNAGAAGKQQSAAAAGNKTAQAAGKKPNQAEKENKPATLNKNEVNRKSGNSAVGGAGAGAAAGKQQQQQQQGANANVNRKRTGGANAASAQQGNEQQQQQQQAGARNVNFRQQNGEAREQRNNRRNFRDNQNGFNGNNSNPNAAADGQQQQQQPRQFRDREQRGPPRNRNFEGRNGKREFDRQSGSDRTGVKAVDKRDGAGAHNWGSVKEAIDDVNKSNNDADAVNTIEKGDESGNEQQLETTNVEEEVKELTLDEWKAQRKQRAKPTFNIRKAGEGEDISQWKKMIVLNNKNKKDNESEEELEFDPAMYPQRVGRQQRVLDIQFNFNDGRRGGGGFGGRGRGPRGPRPNAGGIPSGGGGNNAENRQGGRGGGGGGADGGDGREQRDQRDGRTARAGFERRGADAGGRRNFGGADRQYAAAAPKVNDERQFPTLA